MLETLYIIDVYQKSLKKQLQKNIYKCTMNAGP